MSIIKYRPKAPETNSSSTHTFIWDQSESYLMTLPLNDDGALEIDFKGFDEDIDSKDGVFSDEYIPNWLRKLALVHKELSEDKNWKLLNAVYQTLCSDAGTKRLIVRSPNGDEFYFQNDIKFTESNSPNLLVDSELEKFQSYTGKYQTEGLPVNEQARQLANFIKDGGLYYFTYYDNNELYDVLNISEEHLKWFEKEFAKKFGLSLNKFLKALSEIVNSDNPVQFIIFEYIDNNYPVTYNEYIRVSKKNPILSKFNWEEFNQIIDDVFDSPDKPFIAVP